MDDPIPRILEKLAAVRRRGLKWFGSQKQQFRLERPLNESAVRDFEEKNGITLPQEYRRFLLEAGASGAGPAYGLLPLRDHSLGYEIPSDYVWDPSQPSTDCPLVYCDSDEEDVGRPAVANDRLLSIVGQGCGNETALVVTGNYRGRLVNTNCEGEPAYFIQDTDFLAYYERWLDELLAGWEVTGFEVGMPGGADLMEQILKSPTSTAFEKRGALQTVLRMPALNQTLADTVLGCLTDANPEVRAMSVKVLGKNGLGETDLSPRCQDPDPEVRLVTLRALKKVSPSGWPAQALQALADEDHDVFFTAVALLSDARLLSRDLLTPLIASPEPKKRSTAIWAWGKSGFQVSDAPWLKERMTDEDLAVRRSVIHAAAHSHDRAFLPHLQEMAKVEGGEFDVLARNVHRELVHDPNTAILITGLALAACAAALLICFAALRIGIELWVLFPVAGAILWAAWRYTPRE